MWDTTASITCGSWRASDRAFWKVVTINVSCCSHPESFSFKLSCSALCSDVVHSSMLSSNARQLCLKCIYPVMSFSREHSCYIRLLRIFTSNSPLVYTYLAVHLPSFRCSQCSMLGMGKTFHLFRCCMCNNWHQLIWCSTANNYSNFLFQVLVGTFV